MGRGGAWTAWTPEEDERLRELAADGRPWSSIGAEMGRTGGACAGHARKVGIGKPRAAMAWTAEEDARLRRAFEDGEDLDAAAAELGRSPKGCESRAFRIGLRHGGRWTAEEDELLRSSWTGPASAAWCAAELGRTEGAVRARAKGLGLTDGWAIEEEARLIDLWPSAPMAEVVDECGHTAPQCMAKARSLGVRRPDVHGGGRRRASGPPSDPAPARTGPPAARAGAAWDWKEGRYIARHRDEPVAALAAELGRTEDEVSEIMAAMDAAERKTTC